MPKENPIDHINFIHFPLPPECTFKYFDICATEADYIKFLKTVIKNLDWDGDLAKTRVTQERPYTQYTFSPFANWSYAAPHPVIYLSGTVSIDWRDPYVRAIENYGFATAWGKKIAYDLFLRDQDSLTAAMVMMVWGADVFVYCQENAGKYSKFELELAEYYGMPIIRTDCTSAQETAEMISSEYYPIRRFPLGDRNLFNITKKLISNAVLADTFWNLYSFSSLENNWILNCSGIVARRPCMTPWGPINADPLALGHS